MADKRRRRRKRVRLIKGNIDEDQSYAGLTNNTAVLGVLSDTVNERSFLLSTECTYSIKDSTVDQGPIDLYWAHSDYTLAEVEEYIENTQGWSEGDMVQQEIARRKIRQIGSFNGQLEGEVMNDGRVLKTKIAFIVNSGQGLNLVIYNNSNATLTAGTVNAAGHCWIKPA